MSEMVDLVAKAILMAGPPDDTPIWAHIAKAQREELKARARAAIAVMREPSNAAIKAGAHAWDDDWCTETNALNMWQAMIDEALKA